MRTTSGFTAQKPDLLYGTVPVIVFDANQASHQVLYRFRDFALLNISISVINTESELAVEMIIRGKRS
jgi:hypothetical protein